MVPWTSTKSAASGGDDCKACKGQHRKHTCALARAYVREPAGTDAVRRKVAHGSGNGPSAVDEGSRVVGAATLRPGDLVRIEGSQARPDMNGCEGELILCDTDAATGHVQLAQGHAPAAVELQSLVRIRSAEMRQSSLELMTQPASAPAQAQASAPGQGSLTTSMPRPSSLTTPFSHSSELQDDWVEQLD